MAGSYKHCVNANNEFVGTDNIDNVGDAYEALEEMYDIIQHLTKGDKRLIYEAWYEGHAKKRCPPANLSDPKLAGLFSFERFWKD
jgi:hypothetical protein